MNEINSSAETNDEQRTIADNSTSASLVQNGVLPAVLHLTLSKKWYDMIAYGEKKEEYRELKLYWKNRLHPVSKIQGHRNDDVFRHFDVIEFKNGYGKYAPKMVVECKGISIGKARPEWSEGFDDYCFIISLGNVVAHGR